MTQARFFGFEKLDVYHLSVEMAADVYRVSGSFPQEERFGLTNQLRRAATSVTLNLAEGAGRDSRKDFAHFLTQARGSTYEVASGLQLAVRLGFVPQTDTQAVHEQAQTIAAMLSALARNLKAEA